MYKYNNNNKIQWWALSFWHIFQMMEISLNRFACNGTIYIRKLNFLQREQQIIHRLNTNGSFLFFIHYLRQMYAAERRFGTRKLRDQVVLLQSSV